jgi:RNA polymerase sigma factor (sigma-70 family)
VNRLIKSDEELIEAIRQGGDMRMQALKKIFEDQAKRDKAIRYVMSRGCPRQDAEDIYQDAIIIFDSKASSGEFLQLNSIEGYILSIVKHNWYNRYRKYQRQSDEEIQEDMVMDEDASRYYERQERGVMMRRILALIGERCQQLLLMNVQGYTMSEIAVRLQMPTDVRVRKEKYRCLSRLRSKVQEDDYIRDFIKTHLTSGPYEN